MRWVVGGGRIGRYVSELRHINGVEVGREVQKKV
jgi:hypothetical protein